jgi:hypothetical protein
MGAANGSLVVNEIILPLRDIRVRDGMIWFVASKSGPLPATRAKFWVVIDEQGAVVVRCNAPIEWGEVTDGVTVTVPLAINGHEAEAGGKVADALHEAVMRR